VDSTTCGQELLLDSTLRLEAPCDAPAGTPRSRDRVSGEEAGGSGAVRTGALSTCDSLWAKPCVGYRSTRTQNPRGGECDRFDGQDGGDTRSGSADGGLAAQLQGLRTDQVPGSADRGKRGRRWSIGCCATSSGPGPCLVTALALCRVVGARCFTVRSLGDGRTTSGPGRVVIEFRRSGTAKQG
jgi:hypothetical protein